MEREEQMAAKRYKKCQWINWMERAEEIKAKDKNVSNTCSNIDVFNIN